MKPAAILFDLDNTLYRYAPCNQAALRAVHRDFEAHTSTSWSEFRDLHDAVRLELAREYEGLAASHDRRHFFTRMAQHAGLDAHRERAEQLFETYWDAFLHEMAAAPAAHSVLSSLGSACPLAIVSNHTTAPQRRKLAQLSLEPYFEFLLTSEEVGAEKPDSRVFRCALERLGVTAEHSVMVGDDPHADIHGARSIGMRTVQSTQFTNRDVRTEGADAVIEELADLPSAVAAL